MRARAAKPKARRGAFLRKWMRAPLKTGAIVPSSRFLARRMALEVDVHGAGHVLELGAGTGVVTHALLDGGIRPDRLVVVERDRHFHVILKRHFRHLRLLRGDALHLQELLEKEHIHKVRAIVSSLPLLSMPKAVEQGIIKQMAAVLAEGGVIVQFTYGPKSPISRRMCKQLHLKARRASYVLLNLPPATVWVYERLRA